MTINRAAWRNVHFYDASTGTILGGFYQQGSLTEATLTWIISNVLLILEGPWTIKHRESGRTITPSTNPVMLGDYDIYNEGIIQVSNEPWFARLISHAVSGREDTFRDGVCARDRKCVISGVDRAIPWNIWIGFEAAHVFPLQQETLWNQYNYGRWITNIGSGGSTINSIQNGLLLSETVHTPFNQYLLSINPDDGYRIVTFMPGYEELDGRTLDPICRNLGNPDRVSDDVLRWHFRQSILANMRGVGEPVFETDFPSGSDMMATLRVEPYGKERFEMELATRLKYTGQDDDVATSLPPLSSIVGSSATNVGLED